VKTVFLKPDDDILIADFTKKETARFYRNFLKKSNHMGLGVFDTTDNLCGVALILKDESDFANTFLVQYFATLNEDCCNPAASYLFGELKYLLHKDHFTRVAVYVNETDELTTYALKDLGYKAVLVKNHFGDRDGYYFSCSLPEEEGRLAA
jgi:hypothetical protein